jgi:hypothetical protein
MGGEGGGEGCGRVNTLSVIVPHACSPYSSTQETEMSGQQFEVKLGVVA